MITVDRHAHLKDKALYRAYYDIDLTPGRVYMPRANEPRLVWALAHISKNSDVIDIGCHKGELTNAVWEKTSGRVVGVDISPSAIETARGFSAQNYIQSIEWQVAEAEHLPYSDNSFDVALLCELLEHVVSPKRTIREAERVVRNNGVIVISTPGNALEIDHLEAPERDVFTGHQLDMHVREFVPLRWLARKPDAKFKDAEITNEHMTFKFHLASYKVVK